MRIELNVFMNGKLLGEFVQDEDSFLFRYVDAEKVVIPLSVSMPASEQEYSGKRVRNFFGNLLPEGNVLDAVAREIGTSTESTGRILERIGGDCAGAISLLPAGVEPAQVESDYKRIDPGTLTTMLRGDGRPLISSTAGAEGVRLSLAGAQEKIPVYVDGDSLFLPRGNSPSSHILKIGQTYFPELVENELFCMKLAAKVGLPVPHVTMREHEGRRYLLVTRYDRIGEGERLTRIHQEDFCQALGLSHRQKYAGDGGPGFGECRNLLLECSTQPAFDIPVFFRATLFNFLVWNSDAHAKNFSLLFDTGPIPRFAPLYDLVSVGAYDSNDDLNVNLAMPFGDQYMPGQIGRDDMLAVSKALGIAPRRFLQELRKMAEELPEIAADLHAELVREYGESKMFGKILRLIQDQAEYALSID